MHRFFACLTILFLLSACGETSPKVEKSSSAEILDLNKSGVKNSDIVLFGEKTDAPAVVLNISPHDTVFDNANSEDKTKLMRFWLGEAIQKISGEVDSADSIEVFILSIENMDEYGPSGQSYRNLGEFSISLQDQNYTVKSVSDDSNPTAITLT